MHELKRLKYFFLKLLIQHYSLIYTLSKSSTKGYIMPMIAFFSNIRPKYSDAEDSRNTRNTDNSFGSGTKLLLPSWLLGVQHGERHTIVTMLTVPSDPTTRGAPTRPNWSRLGWNLNSLLFSKYPRIPAHCFRAWRHSHPQSYFLPGIFIMTSLIVTSSLQEREHLHSMCVPN